MIGKNAPTAYRAISLFLATCLLLVSGCSNKPRRYVSHNKDFSIEAPAGWRKIRNNSEDLIIASPAESFSDKSIENCVAYSSKWSKKITYTLDELSRKMIADDVRNYSDFNLERNEEIATESIAGKCLFYSFTDEDGDKSRYLNFMTFKDDKFYTIICTSPYNEFSKYKDIFKRISKSFRLEN